ncbi:hypothetical protein EMIHUDRAFT_440589, partial [Emiliania huxleyi CCMP1516]|uniref:Uncharacterized protein n=2 Tax=Emiliania huxleyi TaxID=2903 RepID=A0A0D3KKR8_EMIH1
ARRSTTSPLTLGRRSRTSPRSYRSPRWPAGGWSRRTQACSSPGSCSGTTPARRSWRSHSKSSTSSRRRRTRPTRANAWTRRWCPRRLSCTATTTRRRTRPRASRSSASPSPPSWAACSSGRARWAPPCTALGAAWAALSTAARQSGSHRLSLCGARSRPAARPADVGLRLTPLNLPSAPRGHRTSEREVLQPRRRLCAALARGGRRAETLEPVAAALYCAGFFVGVVGD